MYTVERNTHACIAHRLVGHEGKCQFLHGHNYEFKVRLFSPYLNSLSMLMDFGDIKKFWDNWIDENWDHSTILNATDPLLSYFKKASSRSDVLNGIIGQRVVEFDGNPTAERMAEFLAKKVRDDLWKMNVLPKIFSIVVIVEETPGNKATFTEFVQED